jgi:hypothetical protein
MSLLTVKKAGNSRKKVERTVARTLEKRLRQRAAIDRPARDAAAG